MGSDMPLAVVFVIYTISCPFSRISCNILVYLVLESRDRGTRDHQISEMTAFCHGSPISINTIFFSREELFRYINSAAAVTSVHDWQGWVVFIHCGDRSWIHSWGCLDTLCAPAGPGEDPPSRYDDGTQVPLLSPSTPYS